VDEREISSDSEASQQPFPIDWGKKPLPTNPGLGFQKPVPAVVDKKLAKKVRKLGISMDEYDQSVALTKQIFDELRGKVSERCLTFSLV
jgi:hypothetical protein